MLFRLREQGGFRGRMLGVDYSTASIELARRIAEGKKKKNKKLEAEAGVKQQAKQEEEEEEGDLDVGPGVEFQVWDILKDEADGLGETFDVVLDKGTFDAVSLSAELDGVGRRVCEGYRERVERLVKRDGGLLVVTSCNWTEEELRGWFEVEGGLEGGGGGGGGTERGGGGGGERRGKGEGRFEFEGRIEYPRFSFGGQTGQSVSSVCFRRK